MMSIIFAVIAYIYTVQAIEIYSKKKILILL